MKNYMPLPTRLIAYMAELANSIENIDLTEIQPQGGFTPNTPDGLTDLLTNLRAIPALNHLGSAGLKAIVPSIGCLNIERNGLGLSWGVWVRANDGTAFGHDELVVAIDSRRRRSFIANDALAALEVIRRVLTAPKVRLRGVSRGWDGKVIISHATNLIHGDVTAGFGDGAFRRDSRNLKFWGSQNQQKLGPDADGDDMMVL